jgi:hypothetical protein
LFRELAYCYECAVQCRNVEGTRYGEEAVTKAEKCCASADGSDCGLASKSNGNSCRAVLAHFAECRAHCVRRTTIEDGLGRLAGGRV